MGEDKGGGWVGLGYGQIETAPTRSYTYWMFSRQLGLGEKNM